MNDEATELLPLYALGALVGPDKRLVEEHLSAGCANCAREMCALDGFVSEIAFANMPVAPPLALRGRVLSAVAGEAKTAKLRTFGEPDFGAASATRWRLAPILAATALIAAASFAIVFLVWSLRDSGDRLDSAVRQLADARRSSGDQEEQIDQQKRLLGMATDPTARTVRLHSTPDGTGGSIDVLWRPDQKRGLLVASDLSNIDKGKTYELWLISGKTPIPAATFTPDAKGNAMIEINALPDAGSPDLFAVTVEPAGGSRLPTGKILLAGPYAGV